jgi:chromosomal replication initiation ATPase DnaA
MNFEKIGLNICKIVSDDSKTKDINIYMADRKDIDKIKYPLESLELSKNELMQHLPYQDLSNGNTRQILYVSGASGSGKSYYTANYMKEYTKMFPKNPIYIVSSLEKDEKLDKLKNVKRLKLNEEFCDNPFSIEDFKDSLLVYDDTEMITNSMIQEKITNILNLVLTTGRHTNTFAIKTSHVTNG